MVAIADGILVAYASVQLMVRRMFTQQLAKVYVYALQFGHPSYIYAIFFLNLVAMIAVICEAFHMTGWSSLGRFDYLDPRDLIIAASRGGGHIASAADDIIEWRQERRVRHIWLLSDPDEGNGSLVVDFKVGQYERDAGREYPADEKTVYAEPGGAVERGPLTPKTPMKMKVSILGSRSRDMGSRHCVSKRSTRCLTYTVRIEAQSMKNLNSADEALHHVGVLISKRPCLADTETRLWEQVD